MKLLVAVVIGLIALPVWAQTAPTTAPAADPTAAPAGPGGGAGDLAAVRQELTKALRGMGVLSEEQRRTQVIELEKVAEASARLAESLPQSIARLEARNLQLQAYNGLAQQAQREDQAAAVETRARQLRGAAAATKDLAAPGASLLGDFWSAQADLIDASQRASAPDARQRQAIARLEKFLDAHPQADDAAGRGVLTSVRLALLRLYDQRGQSGKACRLVQELSATPDLDPATSTALEQNYGYCSALGQRFQASLKTADGKTWSSSDQLGKVILIHFCADWFAPTAELLDQLKAVQQKDQDRGLTLLAVRLEDSAGATPKRELHVDWPVYQEGPGQVSLRQLFGVKSLPRYVLIDRRGRLAASGGSLAILEQVDALLDEGK